jgi:hypothetical protein
LLLLRLLLLFLLGILALSSSWHPVLTLLAVAPSLTILLSAHRPDQRLDLATDRGIVRTFERAILDDNRDHGPFIDREGRERGSGRRPEHRGSDASFPRAKEGRGGGDRDQNDPSFPGAALRLGYDQHRSRGRSFGHRNSPSLKGIEPGGTMGEPGLRRRTIPDLIEIQV